MRHLSSAAIEQLRNERFLKLIDKAYHRSAFYRNLYDQSGINLRQIQTIDDINRLPIVTKKDVVTHIDQLFIGRKVNRIRAFTSGTSGPPLQLYRDYQSIVEEGAYQWRQRVDFGHRPGMKTIIIRGNLHRDQREDYDPFTNSLYLSAYHLSEQHAAWYYDKIRQFAPHAIYAYPSSIESLANILQILGRSVQVPLVFTSSETLYPHQRSKVEAVLGAKVVDWYGNAERSIALEQRADGWYDEIPLYSINEYHDQYTVSTGLINTSLPLIRYRVDDIIHLDKANRIKPVGYRRIKSIQGRSDDILILPDGSRIGAVWGVFDRIPHLRRAQIVQDQQATFRVNLVVCEDFGEAEETLLRRKLVEFIGEEASYTLSYVTEDKIIKAPSGKYKLIVNRLLSQGQQASDMVSNP